MDTGSTTGSDRRPVVAFVPDLMDRSRVEAAGRAARRPVVFVADAEDLPLAVARGAAWVVIDLGRPGVIEVLGRLGAVRTVGFASHIDTALIEAASAAGCDEVLPRSVFFRRLARPGVGPSPEEES